MNDNPLFRTAADFVNNTSRHIFLTGKAGTGKTTFLKYIKQNTRKKCVVVAPTGVAAINAGGVTMHSLFQLPLGPFIPVTHKLSGDGATDQYTLFKNIRVSEDKRELFRDLELLIIDEISMVRCDMLDATDAILRYFRKAPHAAFGGVQVLYIGDLFQLPPVVSDAQWSLLRDHYLSPFFFHSKVVQEAPPVYIELKKIYRQSQQTFIDILNRIRNGKAEGRDLATLNSLLHAEPKEGHKYITLTTHNHKADKINGEELARLPGKKFEFKGLVEGDFPDKTLPTDTLLQLKEGAQVMFIRNDKSEERRYYNGKIATVTKINKEGIRVLPEGSEDEILLEQETWNNIRYSYNSQEERIDEEKLGSFTQYPIRLAWAITIHKSQGLTFSHAIIDAGDSFSAGQVYVALSRCTSLDGLILRSRIHPSSIATDPLVLEFSKRETAEGDLLELLEKDRKEYQISELAKTFDCQKVVDLLRSYIQYLPGRQIPDSGWAMSNARSMLVAAEELQKVAARFQHQMMELIASGHEARLEERVGKAIGYFNKSLTDSVLTPLDESITKLKGVKKIKKYLKYVRALRNSVARKIDCIGRAQYGEVVFNPGRVDVVVQSSSAEKALREKSEKGASLKETLSMFKAGVKPIEISRKRGLALSTIEGHVAQLVKTGDLDIADCVAREKIEIIAAAIDGMHGDTIQPVKQKLGDDFSYAEIRAVMNHLRKTIGQSGNSAITERKDNA